MKVFVSWSGPRSKFVAEALRHWLSDVFHDIEVWVSGHDIGAGARWGTELANELQSSNFGVLCLTPENLDSAWLLYEAGCLSKSVADARVIPYRIGLSATDVGFPLAQFQAVDADEEGTRKLLLSINAVRERPLAPDQFQRVFAKWWPDLDKQLKALPPLRSAPAVARTDRSLLEEILEIVRPKVAAAKPSEPDPNVVWVRERRIYDIGEADFRAMSTEELHRYIKQTEQRAFDTYNLGEQDYLEGKVRLAQQELSRRATPHKPEDAG